MGYQTRRGDAVVIKRTELSQFENWSGGPARRRIGIRHVAVAKADLGAPLGVAGADVNPGQAVRARFGNRQSRMASCPRRIDRRTDQQAALVPAPGRFATHSSIMSLVLSNSSARA